MAYYENGTMLDRHMVEWAGYSTECKAKLNIILVDDGSPKDPALSHIKDVGISIQLYRIKKDIPWNQNGARNLAMTHADKGWCLLTDMDHLLPSNQLKKIFKVDWNLNQAYRPLRVKVDGSEYKRHPNTYLMTRKSYWGVGGYDESFAGYYGTDSTFRRRLNRTVKLIDTDHFHFVLYGREDIPDASTNPDRYGRKGTKFYVSHNKKLNLRKKLTPKPIAPLNFEWERIL